MRRLGFDYLHRGVPCCQLRTPTRLLLRVTAAGSECPELSAPQDAANRAPSNASTTVAVDGGCTSDVMELQQRCQRLEQMLLQRDDLIRTLLRSATKGAVHSSAHCPPVAVATDDASLEAALRGGSPSVVLAPHTTFTLLPHPFQLRDRRIVLFGGPGTRLEASLALRSSTLHASDIVFFAPSGSLPVFDVGGHSQVVLSNCTAEGGRDGVYLSGDSSCQLRHCRMVRNIRGLFEGLGCTAECKGTEFSGNVFHAVLLGGARCTHERAQLFTSPQGDGNTVDTSSRADVVFQYNPMLDVYSDCIKAGRPVVLTAEESTANLCDESW